MSTTTTMTATQTRTYTRRGCNGPVLRAKVKMPGKLLQCRAKSEDFSRKLLPRFVLSDELYRQGDETEWTTTTTTTTPAAILSLPTEILSHIYDSLSHAPSQVALALSCKHMAQVARSLDLSLSSTSPKYAGFLPREVFDVPALMRSLTSWAPPHLRLCDHCLTMRPHAREYWADVDGCDERSDFWVTKTGWAFADARWHKQVHNICPACHVSCSLSDYVDCDGCRALGRLGDVDWSRVTDHWRRRSPDEIEDLRRTNSNGSESSGVVDDVDTVRVVSTEPINVWDLTG